MVTIADLQMSLAAESSNADLASISSDSWGMARGIAGWSVRCGTFRLVLVMRLGLRHDLRVWDVFALRFGDGALLLTPALLVGPIRLPLGPRAAAAIIALVSVTASILAIPFLDEWPSWLSGTAICIIAMGVAMAAASSKPA
jgi:hypothetical protein